MTNETEVTPTLLDRVKELIKKKEFLLAVIAVVVIGIKTVFPELPVSEDVLSKTFWVLIALIVGLPVSELAFQMKAFLSYQAKLPKK